MAVSVRYLSDPACADSWGAEPVVRWLMAEFGDGLDWRFVMGGLAREYAKGPDVERERTRVWLDAAERSRMPVDPRLWSEGPIASTYPACMAVKAAAEQSGDGGYRYLRALREGLFCFRRKLDTTEALVEEARTAGLDVERFRVDLGSHAIVEAFGMDLEWARAVPDEARAAGAVVTEGRYERVRMPAFLFGDGHWVFGSDPDALRSAATAAGAVVTDGGKPEVQDALRRFGRMATREVEEVCGLPGPLAPARLWALAAEWRVKPVRVLTGDLWELA